MNTITLVGRLTDHPDSRTVTGDKTVTTFRLAVDRAGSDGTDYVSITCWNRTAQVTAEHLAKGRLVGIEGRLRHHEWTDDTGNRRERHDIVATSVEFLDSPKKAAGHTDNEA
jgi:single-strand DNA-binding protein